MNAKQASAAVAKYGSQNKAAKELGIHRCAIQRALRGVITRDPAKVVGAVPGKVGRKLSDFRAAYDKDYIVPRRIKEGLKMLGASGWDYEVQFAKSIGVSLMDLGAYRDQFADYVVQISRDGRRAWAGTISTAKQMKEMVS